MATLEPTPVVSMVEALAFAEEVGQEQRMLAKAEATAEIAQLRLDLTEQQQLAESLRAQLDDAEAELYDANTAHALHMSTVHPSTPPPNPTPTPPPPVAATAFGACPTVGTPHSSVLSKYGTKASVRIFIPGTFSRVTRPATPARVHISWKPAIGSTITDAQVIEACTGLRDGDLVEVWHESDVKYRKGQDLDDLLAMKDAFHARVFALRGAGKIAKVLTVNTWAGWSVDSTSSIDPSNLHAAADVLGIDMDGIPAADAFYPYAARQMGAKLVEAFREGGYSHWSVPEFCMPSVDSDPGNVKRVAWFKAECAKIKQGVPASNVPPPLMIAWFDTAGIIGDSEKLTTSNEISAWSTLVAANT